MAVGGIDDTGSEVGISLEGRVNIVGPLGGHGFSLEKVDECSGKMGEFGRFR
jgi:hypothetical protein